MRSYENLNNGTRADVVLLDDLSKMQPCPSLRRQRQEDLPVVRGNWDQSALRYRTAIRVEKTA